ncbi:MAG: hypothetical protein IKK53_00405 [Ruminiclostridium sp.]|nr:hypothetical protein [Ruminiclostridium sp.]
MFIICKSCKKLVDTNKHDFCPKCGSNFNYGDNLTVANHTEDYEEYERRMAEQQRAAVENRMNNTKQATRKETQRRLRNQANQAQDKKNGYSGCVAAIIVIIFGFGVVSGIVEEGDIDLESLLWGEYADEHETPVYTTPEISVDVPDYIDIETLPDDYADNDAEYTRYVIKGETAYTENYSLTCTEIAGYENEVLPPSEGNRYISFTMVLENTTDSERFFYNSPSCVTEYGDATPAMFTGMFLPGRLEPGQTYESTVTFEVPEGAMYFDIYYGDDVVIYTSVFDIEDYDYEWVQE